MGNHIHKTIDHKQISIRYFYFNLEDNWQQYQPTFINGMSRRNPVMFKFIAKRHENDKYVSPKNIDDTVFKDKTWLFAFVL